MERKHECTACDEDCSAADSVQCTTCYYGYCITCAPVHLTPYIQGSSYTYFRKCLNCFEEDYDYLNDRIPNWARNVWPGYDIKQWATDCCEAMEIIEMSKRIKDLSIGLRIDTDYSSEDYGMDSP